MYTIKDFYNDNGGYVVYTDASIFKIEDVSISCFGAILTKLNTDGSITEVANYDIGDDFTNNKGEISAIKMGINMLKDYNISRAALVSDSQISINGLKDWYFNWIKTVDENNILYNTSGRVCNQSLFNEVIRLIINNNIKVNLLHQKGHIKQTAADLQKAKSTFERNKGIHNADINLISLISHYNDKVDNMTRNKLKEIIDSNVRNSIIRFTPVTDQAMLNKYKYLIGVV